MRNIPKRHQLIIEQLKHEGYVTVPELSEKLDVSEVTIRKDLKFLESKKLLSRSHGGASTITSIITDKHVDIKEKMFMEEKSRIADAANTLLEPNDKILIASGTTVLAFARGMVVDFPLTVISAALKVSLELCTDPNIEVIQLGGVIRKNSVSVIGSYSENILDGFSCDKLFIGVDGIDIDYGLTTSNINEASLNQQMISASQKVIVLTDSSKFGKRGFCKICDLHNIHHIITDKNAPLEMIESIRERNIQVTLV